MESNEEIMGIQWLVTQDEKAIMDTLIEVHNLGGYKELIQKLLHDEALRTLAQLLRSL